MGEHRPNSQHINISRHKTAKYSIASFLGFSYLLGDK